MVRRMVIDVPVTEVHVGGMSYVVFIFLCCSFMGENVMYWKSDWVLNNVRGGGY